MSADGQNAQLRGHRAYFAGRFAILLIVTVSLWWAGWSIYATLWALVPAPLRAIFADALENASDKVRQSEPNTQ